MASVATERIPVATLHPSLPTPATKSITSIVTILWPYSSSTRTCALLLAEPDFRLRKRRGQVRVQFFGDAAYAVATSGVGIGDKVVLKLGGVQWLQSSGEEEVVRTPGKSVDWELGFKDRLAMLVTRDGKEFATIDVQRGTPEPTEEEKEEEAVYNTPSRIVGRFSGESLISSTYSSPAFLKRSRLSLDSLFDSEYDLFADEDDYDGEKRRKRRRKSFRDIGVWTYAARTPSPEKGDAMSVDEESLASPSKTRHIPTFPTEELPQTPVSARMTPAEVAVEEEEELVPEEQAGDARIIRNKPKRGAGEAYKDVREERNEQENALFRQFLVETDEAPEGDTEENTEADEPEDQLEAEFSVQDAQVVQGDSEEESLPSVVSDTEEAMPSAAASVRVDYVAEDTEHEFEDDDSEEAELSSTKADSEEESEYSETSETRARRPLHKTREARSRLTTTEKATSEEAVVGEEAESEEPEAEDSSVSAVAGVPTDSEPAPQIQKALEDAEQEQHLDQPDRIKEDSTTRSTTGGPLKPTEQDAARNAALESHSARRISKQDEAEPASKVPEGTTSEPPIGPVEVEPIMPPPVLPQLQMDTADAGSPPRTPPRAPIGPVNAPETPQLEPVTSTNLPLPSPFPGAAGASSYMDARPLQSLEQEHPMVETRERHRTPEVRPATAMSVAMATREAPRDSIVGSQIPSVDPALEELSRGPTTESVPTVDPALGELAKQRAESTENIQLERPSHGPFDFGLDGAALSAIRSKSAQADEFADIIDLSDTQISEPAPAPKELVDTRKPERLEEPSDEQTVTSYQKPSQEPPDVKALADKRRKDREFVGITNSAATAGAADANSHESQNAVSEAFQQTEYQEQGAQSTRTVKITQDAEEQEVESSTVQSSREEMPESQLPESIGSVIESTQEAESSASQAGFSFGEESYVPTLQHDLEMQDAGVERLTEPLSTPRTRRSRKGVAKEKTPVSTPQKRTTRAMSRQAAEQPPQSSAPEIVDLGSESEEDQEMAGTSPAPREHLKTLSPAADHENTRPQRTSLTQEKAKPLLSFSTPQTRRRTRQSTIETLSQADTLTPSRSRRRITRSSQASQVSQASQGASGVAARVAQRRRKKEVKDSDCEWDSTASLSTQSGPSSDGVVPPDFESTTGPMPSQELGSFSQIALYQREESTERPTVSPLTPTAKRMTSVPADEASVEDPHEAQNRRLERELAGQEAGDSGQERSSSPFPELGVEWITKSKHERVEATQPSVEETQPAGLRNDFDRNEPMHSSMLQDDSSMIRAMRTSQWQPETLAEQGLYSVPEETQRTAEIEYPSQISEVQSRVQVASSPAPAEEESQRPDPAQPPREIVEESQLASQTEPSAFFKERRSSASQGLSAETLGEAAVSERPVPQTLQESNILTPEASQQRSQGQASLQQPQQSNVLLPTPQLTQTVSAVASFSQSSAILKRTQLAEPSIIEKQDAAQREAEVPIAAESTQELKTTEATLIEPPTATTGTTATAKPTSPTFIEDTKPSHPSQMSQGTRTSFSYFTPLAHLPSYANSQASPVDVLAVCTRASKPPVRAAKGPRDYNTLFSVADPSLATGESVRVQVFRPWKPALPQVDVGDAVLLRAFVVKSAKGKAGLVSAGESAWCVFRYGSHGHGNGSGSGKMAGGAEASLGLLDYDGEGEQSQKDGGAGGDAAHPIWADRTSGLWGAVASQEVESAAESAAATPTAVAMERFNSESGATREEVHGPPVEFGDEERRETKKLREWWIGAAGKGDGVKEEGESKVKEEKENDVTATPSSSIGEFFRSFL